MKQISVPAKCDSINNTMENHIEEINTLLINLYFYNVAAMCLGDFRKVGKLPFVTLVLLLLRINRKMRTSSPPSHPACSVRASTCYE